MLYCGYLLTKRRTTWEPMNPAPPVIKMFFGVLVVIDVMIDVSQKQKEKKKRMKKSWPKEKFWINLYCTIEIGTSLLAGL